MKKNEWIVKCAKYIGKITNNLAKIEALIIRLCLCLKLGSNHLVIEGDSQIIFNAIRKRETLNWQLSSRLEKEIELLGQVESVKIQHIYREGNKFVDALENVGVTGENILIKKYLIKLD